MTSYRQKSSPSIIRDSFFTLVTALAVSIIFTAILVPEASAAPSRAVWLGLCSNPEVQKRGGFYWSDGEGGAAWYLCGGEVIEIEGEAPPVLCPPGCSWSESPLPGCICRDIPNPGDTGGGGPGDTGGDGPGQPDQGAQCAQCDHDAKKCLDAAFASANECVNFMIDTFARRACREGFMIDGSKPPKNEVCKPCRDWVCGPETSGKQCNQLCPANKTVCTDVLQMDECLDAWRDGIPSASQGLEHGISIDPLDLGIGLSVGSSISVTYPAVGGLRFGCAKWAQKAGEACSNERSACRSEHSCGPARQPLVIPLGANKDMHCARFNPAQPDGNFCNDPNCPCGFGEGDCDRNNQCAGELVCARNNGPHFGLPEGWDVCVRP